jgi:chromosome partitioning protein
MGKIITVSAFKGGVGKTTSATNLAAAVKKNSDETVLLADIDFQANSTKAFGYNPKKKEIAEKNIYTVLHGEHSIKDCILHHVSGVDILPSTFDFGAFDLDIFEDEKKFPRKDLPYILRNMFKPITNDYDYIICDAGPSLSMLATNYITASDEFIIVTQTGSDSLDGTKDFISHIHKVRASYAKGKDYSISIIVTMFDPRTNVSIDILQAARKYADKNNIFIPDTVVPDTVRYENARSYYGVPLVLAENSKYSECYEALAKELIQNGER